MQGSNRVGWAVSFVWASVALVSIAMGQSRPTQRGTLSSGNHVVNKLAEGDDWQSRLSIERCQSCHPMKQGHSHPVHLPVNRALPAGLPLENGRLTCITCHQPDAPSHYDQTLRDGRMLRPTLAAAANACTPCHSREAPTALSTARNRRAAGHALALGKAHGAAEGLSSRSCLSCHDGVMSGEGDIRLNSMGVAGLPIGSLADAGSSHPVDVAYPLTGRAVSASGDPFLLRDPRRVDDRVALEGGSITCASCHDLYSPDPSLLVMSNRNSALCLSCHIK